MRSSATKQSGTGNGAFTMTVVLAGGTMGNASCHISIAGAKSSGLVCIAQRLTIE